METEEIEDLEKPWRKSVSDSWKIDKESAKVRPELLPEKEEMPCTEQESQDTEPRRHIPLQRNSIFNRTMRRRSQAKARGTPERNSSHLADSQENGKSINEPLTLNLPQSRKPLWRIPMQMGPGAQKTSESSSTPGNGTTPEECPALADSPTTLTEALQMIHPIPADSWRNLIEQIGLLYQEYRDKSTLQEIETRRQQDAEIQGDEDGSPTGEDTPEEEEEEEEPASPPQRRTVPQICLLSNPHSRFNLWQDLPEIQSSGVLEILQPEEVKLQEAMFELVTSEASYYKSLNLLVSHFMENERMKKILHPSEAHILFSNVQDVLAVSERFLLELEHRMEENIVISDVCDIVYHYAASHFSVYITYVSNQTYQERTYKQLLQEKAAFRELIAQLELDPKCRGLPFSSFLILPFQRITRLKLLVQNILKRVEESSEREGTALEAHRELEMVVKACNEGVRKMSRTEQMISIQKKMEFKIKSVPIISHSRWLLKQGELQQMSGPKTSRTLRTKKLFREIYLFLFNDLLVICRQIPGDKYQVFDSASRGLLRVEELEDQGQTLANVFILRLLENADDREATYMLKASSQSEMKRWMTSLAPNRRTKFVSFTSRLLDCPQVQCVHPYVAQQPDELTLELADILNILEKTEDGWIFGERLHDQERGWFPSSMTEEILNPKIRSQNLKECIRVHKMDDPQRSQNKDRRKLGSRNRQ
ncbi:ephexin-1 isoform X1 [Marmota monax]|uniref:ephexin-1 isoform X1 n=1 Tax=Marmota monax TaxID=9995 RepID=UPI001E8A5699|nr:ephexin-1 isoform X1 [Marmota monax]XP_046295729.1 ephexin-1 isoform X1 [Marmota monax]KAI6053815.1 NGEF [Marmota monax]KAI6065685.1 NGEF [Marmota monax]